MGVTSASAAVWPPRRRTRRPYRRARPPPPPPEACAASWGPPHRDRHAAGRRRGWTWHVQCGGIRWLRGACEDGPLAGRRPRVYSYRIHDEVDGFVERL